MFEITYKELKISSPLLRERETIHLYNLRSYQRIEQIDLENLTTNDCRSENFYTYMENEKFENQLEKISLQHLEYENICRNYFYDYNLLKYFLESRKMNLNLSYQDFQTFHYYLSISKNPNSYDDDKNSIKFPDFINFSISSFQKLNINQWLNDEV
jgi:hypothetical protein